MELGLTLGGGGGGGDASTPSGLLPKDPETGKITRLALGLGVNSSEKHHRQQGTRSDPDRTVSIDAPPPGLQLDLLPLWTSENTNTGSSDGGSSGAAARGFDVNSLPAGAGEEAEAEAVSSPNSVASAFRMEFSILGRGGRKRDSEAVGGGGDQAERTTSSRASDEDENGLTRKKLRLSKEQSAFLEESFKEHSTLNPKQKLELAKQLSLRPRQVEVWFQNRRARTKLKQTEVDCEYLKRCCETLTEENRRLHKELQELRALKSSNPYYMQLPATTLTMCPSCERVAATTTTTTIAPSASAAAAAAATTIVASSDISNPTSKATPFPVSRPNFYPFPPHAQPQKSAAS